MCGNVSRCLDRSRPARCRLTDVEDCDPPGPDLLLPPAPVQSADLPSSYLVRIKRKVISLQMGSHTPYVCLQQMGASHFWSLILIGQPGIM